MLKILLSVIKNPALLKPDLALTNTSNIYSHLTTPQDTPNQQIKDSKIWIFDKDDTLVPLH